MKVKGKERMRRRGVNLLAMICMSAMVLTGTVGCGSNSGALAARTEESSPAAKEDTTQDESGKEESAADEGARESEDLKKNETSEAENSAREEQDEAPYQKKPDPAAADGSKILFVGNSHTYVNDLPGVFAEMAAAGGHDVDVYDLTEGMYTLKQFSDPEDELGAVLSDALETETWDFVVLQENTNAALTGKSEKEMFPYARILDKKIQNAGGQTVFFMTWSPKDGAGAISRKVVQTLLSESYQEIAKELDALLIPGGDLFMEELSRDESLELWDEDGQHPSEAGTYLTACAAYALFFQETPVGNPYLSGLDGETAGELQQTAESYMLGGE